MKSAHHVYKQLVYSNTFVRFIIILIGAVFNLVNCILGSGIIGLPFAVKEAGLVGGVLLLCIVSYLASKLTTSMNFPKRGLRVSARKRYPTNRSYFQN